MLKLTKWKMNFRKNTKIRFLSWVSVFKILGRKRTLISVREYVCKIVLVYYTVDIVYICLLFVSSRKYFLKLIKFTKPICFKNQSVSIDFCFYSRLIKMCHFNKTLKKSHSNIDFLHYFFSKIFKHIQFVQVHKWSVQFLLTK